MLNFNPETRITVEEALNHPFLKELHDEKDEPNCTLFNFDFEEELPTRPIKELIYETIVHFNEHLVIEEKKDTYFL